MEDAACKYGKQGRTRLLDTICIDHALSALCLLCCINDSLTPVLSVRMSGLKQKEHITKNLLDSLELLSGHQDLKVLHVAENLLTPNKPFLHALNICCCCQKCNESTAMHMAWIGLAFQPGNEAT